VEHVGSISETRNIHNVLVGCSKGQTTQDVNIKINLEK
jgi:hypothetical protein